MWRLTLSVAGSTFAAAANSVMFKKMVNSYKGDDPDHPHDYEFFANQFNVAMYVAMAAAVVLQRRISYGAHWWRKQSCPLNSLMFMGFLDSAGSILSTIGGAYVAGALQNLLNQVIIPFTLLLSFIFLGQTYTPAQTCGAVVIFLGASVAVVQPGGADGVGASATTWLGLVLFFASIIPAAMSNVYKEYSFSKFQLDLFYLTTFVSLIQVLFGFLFLPLLQVPAFGGVPIREIPQQFSLGFKCFLGQNSLPGDDCDDAMLTMIGYVVVNFLYNVLTLIITKTGGATLLVISAALALPVTNFAFKLKVVMGEDTEPFEWSDVIALVIVLAGFLMYSLLDDLLHRHREGRRLPIQFAAGSTMYMRERSNSDPSTPGYTPFRVKPAQRRGSMEEGGARTPQRPMPSPSIPIPRANSQPPGQHQHPQGRYRPWVTRYAPGGGLPATADETEHEIVSI